MTATILESTGSRYRVVDDAGSEWMCTARGRLRLEGKRTTNPVAVGDRVEISSQQSAIGNEAIITDLLPRRNYIIRRASNLSKEAHILAANLDRALIVASLHSPKTPREFIDRFLVTCQAYHVPAAIILNKTDLAADAGLAEFHEIYASAGYEVIDCQANNNIGIDHIRELTAHQTTLLAGNSGVGKSTLIKALIPSANPRIGRISTAHNKGMHTTTFARMYRFAPPTPGAPAGNGSIIDTPGIKGFGLIDIAPTELAHYFPEMMRYLPSCAYHNCTHTHEPDCAVVEAVQQGIISLSRYESYLKILDEDGKYR